MSRKLTPSPELPARSPPAASVTGHPAWPAGPGTSHWDVDVVGKNGTIVKDNYTLDVNGGEMV